MTGIYIHIPFCNSKCGYCSFYSVVDKSVVPLYLCAIEREMAQKSAKYSTMSDILHIDTVYIGGGTPSCLPNGAIGKILSCVKKYFVVDRNAEITVEANPDSASVDFIKECECFGVNRISMGLQSHNDAILKKIGRRHNFSEFLNAIDNIKSSKIDNVSVDLMSGLPLQSIDDLSQSIDIVTNIGVIKHISLYALTVESGTLLSDSGYEPNGDLQASMYDLCVKKLADCGYNRYEVSNFAKDGYYSRHNSKYWNHTPYIGFGCSAHSFDGGIRYENPPNISQYNIGSYKEKCIKLSQNDLIEERIMLSLRTFLGLDTNKLQSDFKYDIMIDKQCEIRSLLANNFITLEKGIIKVANDGFYILNSIILKLI